MSLQGSRSLRVAAAVLLASCSTAVAAQDEQGSGFRIGVTGGTLGVGPEAGYRFSETFGVRANATFLSINATAESDDLEFDGNLRLRSAGVMVDIHPFGGGFRLTPGLRFNGNRARAVALPNAGQTYEIDGNVYTADEIGTLTAETDIKDVAPSLTLGYGGGLAKGLVFGIEAGALFQGSVGIKPLVVTGVCANPSSSPDCATLAADLESERQSVEDDIEGYKVYPILQLSLSYRF